MLLDSGASRLLPRIRANQRAQLSHTPQVATRRSEDTVKCPIDQETLIMTERQGVEIDYCPRCRGVWLDRGELDKLIDRDSERLDSVPAPGGRERDRDDDDRSGFQGPRRKKKGFLSEMFEFGD